MSIERFEHDHGEIHAGIHELRKLIAAGIERNAAPITQLLLAMSASIKLHLAVEDRVVYPAFMASKQPAMQALGRSYQEEMGGIAQRYMDFARRWNLANRVAAQPDAFRAEANDVFKALFLRTRREEAELYPAYAKL